MLLHGNEIVRFATSQAMGRLLLAVPSVAFPGDAGRRVGSGGGAGTDGGGKDGSGSGGGGGGAAEAMVASGADDDEDAMELDENETADESGVGGASGKLPTLLDAAQAANTVQFCCDLCGACPIVSYRWHCATCQDFDLCDACYHAGDEVGVPPHVPGHEFVRRSLLSTS